MKKNVLVLIFLFLVLSLTTTQAQSTIDKVEIGTIALQKADNTTQSLRIGESMGKAVQVLGQPDKISDYYMEISEVTAKLYNYKGNLLYFVHDSLRIFDLKDPSIQVSVNGTVCKVGDKIQEKRVSAGSGATNIQRYYFNFPLEAGPGRARNLTYQTESTVDLMYNSINLEWWLGFLFDTNDRLMNIYIQSN